MAKLKRTINHLGISLVEVILAIALFSLFSTALLGLLMSSYGSDVQAQEKDVSSLYAQEGIEAVASIRRQGWNLLVNGTHGLTKINGYWEFSGSSDLLDNLYTRSVAIADACRDSGGVLVDCLTPGAVVDLYAKLATVTVSYTAINLVGNEMVLTAYFTTWQTKDWLQTDWSGGSGQSLWLAGNAYNNDDGNIDVSTPGEVRLASFGDGCGTKVWTFDLAGDYTYDPVKVEVFGGVAQLIGSTGTCSGTPTACTTYPDQTSCQSQAGCNWSGGAGVCNNAGSCSVVPRQQCESTCGAASCSRQGPNCVGTLDCSVYTTQASCTGCGQCAWSSGGGSCGGTPTACTGYTSQTSCQAQQGCSWAGGSFPTDRPSINPTASFSVGAIDIWSRFKEVATKNGGEIYYQLSDDDGASWQYWNGSGWVSAGANNYNTAVVVNTNLNQFSVSGARIMFRAFLESNGSQQVQLDQVEISCNKEKEWPFDVPTNYTYDPAKIEVSGGVAQLAGPGGGTNAWTFTNATNYTYDPLKIEVTSGVAQLVGSASCSGTPTACTAYPDQTSCQIQAGCNWSGGTGVCSNAGSCSASPRQECNACGTAGCSRQGPNCVGTLDCSVYTTQASCTGCGQCAWSSGGGSCGGTPTACTGYTSQTSCQAQQGCSWAGNFPTDRPAIKPTSTFIPTTVATWTSFTETAVKNGGEIYYKLYDGTNWYWYNGSWQITDETNPATASTAAVVDANITTFPISGGQIMFKAFFSSDGGQQIQLDQVGISWSEGSTGACSGTPTACTTYADQTSCQGQAGCNWSGGAGVCSNAGSCSAVSRQICENTCGTAGCSRQGSNCVGSLNCSVYTSQAACTGCGQCAWSSGGGSCGGTPTACTTYASQTSCQSQAGCSWAGNFPTDRPSISPTSSFSVGTIDIWSSFKEVATKNGGEIYYQLSDDDGASWQYWNGSGWVSAGANNYNPATIINTNIIDFSTTTAKIMFRAFLASDGNQQVILDRVRIGWDEPIGSTGYALFGILESSAFDMSAIASVNIIEWQEIIPSCSPTCMIRFQVRTAPDSGGSPGIWTAWYGAGGSGSYFTTAGGAIVDPDLNFNQWVQYRVELTSDGSDTPVLQDVIINYLP